MRTTEPGNFFAVFFALKKLFDPGIEASQDLFKRFDKRAVDMEMNGLTSSVVDDQEWEARRSFDGTYDRRFRIRNKVVDDATWL